MDDIKWSESRRVNCVDTCTHDVIFQIGMVNLSFQITVDDINSQRVGGLLNSGLKKNKD